MKINRHSFKDTIKIYNIGDVHRGDANCNVASLKKTIEAVNADDNARWVSTGDMLNVALKTSLSDCYTSKSLQEELQLVVSEFEPIASKCLGFVGSNHHRRLGNLTGLNLDNVLASELGVPYLGKIALLNISCGKSDAASSYFIAMHHGVGGGKRRGGKTNNLEDLGAIIPCADVYLEGHTHAFNYFVNETAYIDKKHNRVQYQQSHFVTTGHYLRWDDSYAQDYKMKPMPNGCAVVTLHANSSRKRQVDVDFFS